MRTSTWSVYSLTLRLLSMIRNRRLSSCVRRRGIYRARSFIGDFLEKLEESNKARKEPRNYIPSAILPININIHENIKYKIM